MRGDVRTLSETYKRRTRKQIFVNNEWTIFLSAGTISFGTWQTYEKRDREQKKHTYTRLVQTRAHENPKDQHTSSTYVLDVLGHAHLEETH